MRFTKRLYVKFMPVDWIEGSIRWQLTSEERGVWADFINFAGICNQEGWICDKDHRPFPHDYLANRFNIDIELFERTLDKCKQEGRMQENSQGLLLVHWQHYQSEYQRQKPSRDAKKELTDHQKRVREAVEQRQQEIMEKTRKKGGG